MHLDSPTYDALLSGTMPPEEARSLALHLEGDCEQCEAFLVERREIDAMDGPTEAALAHALPPPSGAGNDLEFARIRRALVAARPGRRRLVVASLAASLVLAGVAGMLGVRAGRSEWDGAKGHRPHPIPVRLRFLEMGEGGQIQKGISGEPVGSATRLLFEVEAGQPANVALVRVSPAGETELVWRSHLATGRTQVTAGGRPAGYPLRGLAGSQRFVLVASDGPLEPSRATSAASALAPSAVPPVDAPALDGLSLDAIDVSVR